MKVLNGKTVLVTGGTGSMGRRFVERADKGEFGAVRDLIVFSRDETKQYEMKRAFPKVDFRIGDIRRYEDVVAALDGVDVVVHAAALKQVPSCEYFPEQAILTNCIGTQNLVRAICENDLDVESVVAISTDKACKPTTVMGMTKALQERIIIAANVRRPQTRWVCVRYGNVIESRGSVIPLFREQIAAGGPVTVTNGDMTRFLLTLDQAVDTMIAALECGRPGETFVPRAPSASIGNIAHVMCFGGSGVKTMGIRPGEKMHEIMVSEEEAPRTVRRGSYIVITPMLPEIRQLVSIRGELDTEYSSADDPMSAHETRDLLKQHGVVQ